MLAMRVGLLGRDVASDFERGLNASKMAAAGLLREGDEAVEEELEAALLCGWALPVAVEWSISSPDLLRCLESEEELLSLPWCPDDG